MFWCGEELWKNTWTYCRIACLRCSKNVLRTSSIEEKYKWQFLSPNNLMLNFFRRSRVAIFFCVCLTLCRFLLSEFERKCTCSTATSLCSKWMKSWNTISCVGLSSSESLERRLCVSWAFSKCTAVRHKLQFPSFEEQMLPKETYQYFWVVSVASETSLWEKDCSCRINVAFCFISSVSVKITCLRS